MATSTPISTGAVKSKLLLGLDDTALRHVRDAAQVRGMGPNENVTVAGERPDNLFLLQAGRARSFIHTESGSEINLLWQVPGDVIGLVRSEEHTSELQSRLHLVCRLLLEKKKETK